MVEIKSKYNSYPAYKESGITSILKMPTEWKLKRLKYLVTYNDDSLDENHDPDDTIKYVDISSVDRTKGIVGVEEILFEKAPSRARRLVRSGDTIVSTVRTYLKAIAYIDQRSANFVVSTGFAVLRPRESEIDSRFLGYLINDERLIGDIVSNSDGVSYPAINPSVLVGLYCFQPTIKEQQSIANFLDQKTAQIDALIEQKEILLELLTEKRTAIITQAVTKGLDPNVKMKDSGIVWLGEVPEHWDVCLMKYKCNISYGIGGEIDRTLKEGYSLLSLPNINKDGTLKLDDIGFVEIDEREKKSLILEKGDLLFNWRNGSSDHLGKTAYFDLEGEYFHASFLLKLRFDKTKDNPRFYQFALNGFQITGFFASSKAGVNNTFNMNELSNLWITVPPKEEQDSIARYIVERTRKLDEVKAEIVTAIDRLKEYRSSLITTAVTGQIDVRTQ
ncbi:MAG: restriction endonuclease subunit S [Bacteroidota bacterium]